METQTISISLDKKAYNDHILNSYSAGDPDKPAWFIYEYVSKRRILVEVDSETGKVHFLKEL